MDMQMYYLMHRDDRVAMVGIDSVTGVMLRVSPEVNRDLIPPGGNTDAVALRKWWSMRAVPISQGNIQQIFEQLGISTPHSYLVKNLGLSLNDHYWIKPLNMAEGWDGVNLFTNDFRDPIGDLQFSKGDFLVPELPPRAYSPSAATKGQLKKKWIIQADGKRCLVKGNRGNNSQESLNEVVATLLHKKQSTASFTTYTPVRLPKQSQIHCMCENFASSDLEFIPAIDVINSKKKDNATSYFEHFIQICSEHGMVEDETRSFLEYQILSDYVLTNVDRHFSNFGVLRDTHTLKYVGMAPIFDCGNSMFCDNPLLPQSGDLTKISVNSFRSQEGQLLRYVTQPKLLDCEKLPTVEELREIYTLDPLIVGLEVILAGYQKKIEMLSEYQYRAFV